MGDGRYVLYEHLRFFREKKWILIILPILVATFALIGSILYEKQSEVSGSATIYYGSVSEPVLTDPVLLQKKYEEKYPDATIELNRNRYMTFKYQGDSPNDVEQTLEKITKNYKENLDEVYQEEEESLTSYKSQVDKRLIAVDNLLVSLEEQVENEQLSAEKQAELSLSRYELETKLDELQKTMRDIEQNQENLEEPDIINVTVSKNDQDWPQWVIAGYIFGLLIALGWLVLWKYLIEARRNFEK